MSNIYKHQRCVHRVSHTDHSDCDCQLFLGPWMSILTMSSSVPQSEEEAAVSLAC